MLIVGEKEENEKLVSVRSRKEGDKGAMNIEALIDLLKEEIDNKTI